MAVKHTMPRPFSPGAPLVLLLALLAPATASLSFAARPAVAPPSAGETNASVDGLRPFAAAVSAESARRRFPVSRLGGPALTAALRASRGGGSEEEVQASGDEQAAAPTDPAPVAEAPVEAVAEAEAEAEAEAPGGSKLGPGAPPPGPLRRALPSFPWHRVPNVLTYLRCFAIPLLVGLFYTTSEWGHVQTGSIFAVASFTDWLDGYLARRWDITSAFGAFLDPVADKLMVSTALILLAGRHGPAVAVPASVILAREIAVSALREWMAQRGLRDSVKVGFQGKVKTAATMVALTLLLLVPVPGVEGAKFAALAGLQQPGMALLYLSALVTVTSGSVYFRAAAPVLMGDE